MLNGMRFGAARSIAEEWKGDAWGRAAERWAADTFGWTGGGERAWDLGNLAAPAIISTASADFPAVIDLATLDGTNGFAIDGLDYDDQSGRSVSSAGDINGDGYDDILIGARKADPNGHNAAGESYVVFGKVTGFAPNLDLATLNGTNGFRITGVYNRDYSGDSVCSAGDVNGDGFDDIIIGAPYAGPGGNSSAGESYVVFGKAGGFAASLDLATLDGTNGFRLDGIDENDRSGYSVSSAGDFNGDGFDDIIIGASRGDPRGTGNAGESYVVFGMAEGFAARFDLSTLDGTNGIRLTGIDKRDESGLSVSSAGDVNGDGFDDVIIGARHADPGGDYNAGECYVVFGKAGSFPASFNVAKLDGTNGFLLEGIDPEDICGSTVSSAGDVNGDGFDDIIIGANLADPGGKISAGESYVVFGMASGFTANIDLAALDGSNGFRIDGLDASDYCSRVASAGDVNGDGYDDIIIGAPFADVDGNRNAGECYVLFGKAEDFSASFDLASLDGTNGFRLDGTGYYNNLSRGRPSSGDVNGDGFDDIIVGAPYASPGGDSSAGETYVVFGRAPSTAVTRIGSAADQTIRGGEFNDTLLGKGGNDRLGGGGGADTLNGGTGNDWAYYDTADAAVRASLNQPGNNTGEAAGDNYISIENLFGSRFDDTLTGDSLGNRLRGDAGADAISGRGGDDTLIGNAGHDSLEGGTGADRFTFTSLDSADSDTISDFTAGLDKVALDDKIFGFAEGALPASSFVTGAAAQDADDRVIYDAATGQLFFDADGTGAAAQILIATLTGAPTLAASDIVVV